MHLILGILGVFLFAIIFIIVFVISGINELRKYIQERRIESYNPTDENIIRHINEPNKSKLIIEDLEDNQFDSNNGTDEIISTKTQEEETRQITYDKIIVEQESPEIITGSKIPKEEDVEKESDTLPKETNNYQNELESFYNMIYYIKLLGHEDSRFRPITLKAYEIISKFGNSLNFFADVINYTQKQTDFSSELIHFIVTEQANGTSSYTLIKKIRNKYIVKEATNKTTNPKVVLHSKTPNTIEPVYIEADTYSGSHQLTAKAKIAHKHKAIQYANIIGGKLLDGFNKSECTTFHQYVKNACKSIAQKGAYTITNEEFEPQQNIIKAYKRAKTKSKNSTIAANIITPRHKSKDAKADIVLTILDKLTSARLPRYEVPSIPSTDDIIQREYKKENPFDIYNDLFTSEFTNGALNDRRFALLYQLILFISECIANGMTEEETLEALSSLRIVKKSDLEILREREIHLKGLSEKERRLVLNSEVCKNPEMTNLYIDLIRHYKHTKQQVNLSDYLIGVLIKNYKDSLQAWPLLKYTYLRTHTSVEHIANNIWEIFLPNINTTENQNIKGSSEIYFSLDDCIQQLKYDYEHNVNLTKYNFQRDKITIDMANIETLKKFLPKRFDNKDRLCSPILIMKQSYSKI